MNYLALNQFPALYQSYSSTHQGSNFIGREALAASPSCQRLYLYRGVKYSKPAQRSKRIQRFYENFCALNAVLVCEDLKDTYETWSEHFPGSSIAILS